MNLIRSLKDTYTNYKGRINFLSLGFLFSASISYFLTEKIIESSDLLNTIVTFLSIFSGFLFLIIPSIYDLSKPILNNSRTKNSNDEDEADNELDKAILLFLIYITSVISIFIIQILPNMFVTSINEVIISIPIKLYFSYVAIFISIYSVYFSFSLPFWLRKLLTKAREKRKKELNIR